jgi:hypothetical protein
MIARTEALMATDPNRITLTPERIIDQAERAERLRIAAAPLPAIPTRTAAALRREALRRRGMTDDQIADLMTYSRARPDR